jgi:hypothetical protein
MAGWVAGAGVKVYAATDWDAAEYERGEREVPSE